MEQLKYKKKKKVNVCLNICPLLLYICFFEKKKKNPFMDTQFFTSN